MTENWQDAGFGLYVHWPFCEAKCPYCDFNSHVAAQVDHAAWKQALVSDLRHQAEQVPGRRLSSIFFGGGTPSRMHPDTTAAIIEEARRIWPTVNDLEITLEANPTSVEADRFAAFAQAGVNRVSIGLQALRDRDLRRLGRTHDVTQALHALEIAREQFTRVSFDVIYARQDQTLQNWTDELSEIIALEPDHLSLYQLTIEPGTVFARRAEVGQLKGLPAEDDLADMFLLTNDIMSSNGQPAYETSNHATPGAECRHNMIYWRAGDWLGVGPGAHGRYGMTSHRIATLSEPQPAAWLNQVKERGHGVITKTGQDPTDHAEEYLMTAIRLSEGLSLVRLADLGLTLDPGTLAELTEQGLVSRSDDWIRPSLKGRALADGIASYVAASAVPARDRVSQS